MAAVAGIKGDVSVHDVASGRVLQTVPFGGERVEDLFLSEDGRSLYLVGAARTFARWDIGARRFRWRSDGAGARHVQVSADGRKVVTLASDGTVTQWGRSTGTG
ncbi:WD40 repeat domain-containing protein [Streptomyces sp. ISL-11]|nr:WD40 repeat domain-containing protein [Streptomyces sp. ISL-11]